MRRFIASSFGLGLIPRRLWGSDKGAGTFGAALAAVVALPLIDRPLLGTIAAATAVVVSLWASAPFAEGDPGWVAIDEVAGTLVALIGLSAAPWVAALVVFRVADITKAFPGMKRAERLPGAIGVTADDVLAGLYGLAAGWVLTGLGG